MRVGYFGGTFDPIHLGHLDIASRALEAENLDFVLFVPTAQNPLKNNRTNLFSDAERVWLIERAIEGEDRFRLCLDEVRAGGVSYTFDTILRLLEKHPDWEITLVLGEDAFSSLGEWKESSKLKKMVKVWVYPRVLAVSGTDIRKRILGAQ